MGGKRKKKKGKKEIHNSFSFINYLCVKITHVKPSGCNDFSNAECPSILSRILVWDSPDSSALGGLERSSSADTKQTLSLVFVSIWHEQATPNFNPRLILVFCTLRQLNLHAFAARCAMCNMCFLFTNTSCHQKRDRERLKAQPGYTLSFCNPLCMGESCLFQQKNRWQYSAACRNLTNGNQAKEVLVIHRVILLWKCAVSSHLG